MLEIGDKIYEFQYNTLVGRQEIIRVTPKSAITNLGIKLKREVEENGCIREIAPAKFNSRGFFLETKELKNLFEKKVIIKKISNFDFTKIDLQYLIEIFEIIKSNAKV